MKKERTTNKYFTSSDVAHFIIYSYLSRNYLDGMAYKHSMEIVEEIKSVLNFSEKLKGRVAPKKSKKNPK